MCAMEGKVEANGECAETEKAKSRWIETVLVIKGAGNHRPGQTLDSFLSGFWPAVLSLDDKASMRLCGSPPPELHVERTASGTTDAGPDSAVEIETSGKVIRVREVYWEHGLAAPSAITAVLREWQMASFALGQSMLRVWRPDLVEPGKPKRLHWLYLISTFVIICLAVYIEPATLPFLPKTLGPIAFWETLPNWQRILGMGGITGLLAFLPRWFDRLQRLPRCRHSEEQQCLHCSNPDGGRYPGLPLWVFLALITVLMARPLSYIVVMAILLFVQLCILFARYLLWPRRASEDSDTGPIFDEEPDTSSTLARKIVAFVRRSGLAIVRLPLSSLNYRTLVLLALPIVMTGFALVTLLRWTKIFSGVADGLEGILRLTLAGTMGDIVGYAMEPGQAIRIRQILEEELTSQSQDQDVRWIHVFAHSQGTPISYEVVFGNSPSTLLPRRKLSTFMTIGSVLSYYAQSNDVLDLVPHSRFPVAKATTLDSTFLWINAWNLTDPITEFSGLDEFVGTHGEAHGIRHFRQVKTAGRLIPWRSHSSYWENLSRVMSPLAERILGLDDPQGWQSDGWRAPEEARVAKNPPAGTIDHALRVLALTTAFLIVGWGMLLFLRGENAGAPLLQESLPRNFNGCEIAGEIQDSLESIPRLGGFVKESVNLRALARDCEKAPNGVRAKADWFYYLTLLLYAVTWILGLAAVISDVGGAAIRLWRRWRDNKMLARKAAAHAVESGK